MQSATLRRALPWSASLILASLAAASCSDDGGGAGDAADTSVSADVVDASDDAAADGNIDDVTTTDAAVDGADADVGFVLPEYEPVACSEREPAHGATTLTPPACSYEVSYPQGIVGITESCGDAVDAPVGLHITLPAEDAGSAAAILWTTADTTRESVVRVGDAPDALDRVYWGHSFTYSGLAGRVAHEVHLCGLEAGRTYYYQAGGEGAWSEVHSFATAPALDSDDEIVFGVVGDSRSDTFEVWGDIVERMRGLGAEFLVFTGDAVEAGPVQAQWDLFFEQGQPGLAEMPYIPTNGNHDLLVAQYFGQFALPNNEVNFAVRYGPLAFVSLTDFNPRDQDAIDGEFAEYLDEALTRNDDATWSFLVNHRAFYSSALHGSSLDLQEAWGPIVDAHAVDLVLNGHDHNYERSVPIRAGELAEAGEGTVYTVVGGAGAPLYDSGANWWTEISESTDMFGMIRVTPSELVFTAYRADGTQLDTFTLER